MMYVILTVASWFIGLLQGFFLYYVCRLIYKDHKQEGRENL